MKRRVVWAVAILMVLTTVPGITQANASISAITEVNYPFVAALARASILADQPVAPTTQKVTYKFEDGVPIENQNMIKEGTDNLISRFGNILNYCWIGKLCTFFLFKGKYSFPNFTFR